MAFGCFGSGQDKRKSSAAVSSGTGFGGKKGDKKRLLAGRKKAERASTRDDKAHLDFFQQMQTRIEGRHCDARGGDGVDDGLDVDADDREKLAGLLRDVFQNQVPSEWGPRRELYGAALVLARALAADAALATLLGDDAHDREGVLYWLLDFRQQAAHVVRHHHRRASRRGSRRGSLGEIPAEPAQEDRDDVRLATEVIQVADAAAKMARRRRAPRPAPEVSVVSLHERYQAQLGPLRFDSAEEIQDHFFLKRFPYASPLLKTRLIFKELAAYRTALPVEYGSSCFCRVLDRRVDLLRVLITGPDDTPYANGCFFFDIFLPAAYPRVPPLCQFLTTGGGGIRFNPNLYNCGKVCLSLLGTWTGPGWISGQSTLLQVLISIQSLILVPDPYFNEPCYDREMGTARGRALSREYNENIRKYTVAAAIEAPLKSILDGTNQYVEFETAMIKHFLEKSSLIRKELSAWVMDDPSLLSVRDSICDQLTLLATRERGSTRSTRSCGTSELERKAAQSKAPIVPDDSEEGDVSETPSGAATPHNTAESDSADEDEEKEVNVSPRDTSSTECEGGLIGLTG